MITFNEYQKRAPGLNLCKDEHKRLHALFGLMGEVGEIAEKVKKLYRDGDGVETPEFLEALKKEISDVLWYVADVCSEYGFQLQEIAEVNLEKLESRKARGVLCGSGDNR
jgi:NTP pyrophosphatase (non-canonical NTP hydrolase)